jgi:hypothetical protein
MLEDEDNVQKKPVNLMEKREDGFKSRYKRISRSLGTRKAGASMHRKNRHRFT